MRLIDADKLIELLNKKYGDDENVNEAVFYLVGVISGMSTVYADDVVRCKDCKHFKKTFGWNALEYTECDHFDCGIAENDFCSWGVKK